MSRSPKKYFQNASLTVLLVEDDPDVRLTIVSMLKMLGLKTLVASSGKNAIQIVLSDNPLLDLVISAFKMPHIDGVQTLMAIRGMRPEVKTILCCTNLDLEDSQWQSIDGCVYLGKPFNLEELCKTINRALIPGTPNSAAVATPLFDPIGPLGDWALGI